jgi:hypothetical protein
MMDCKLQWVSNTKTSKTQNDAKNRSYKWLTSGTSALLTALDTKSHTIE